MKTKVLIFIDKNATQIFRIQNFSVEREKMKDFLHHEEKKKFFFVYYYTLKIYNIAIAIQLHLEPNFYEESPHEMPNN